MSRERDRNKSRSSRNDHKYLIKIRGFPSTTNKDEIKKFLYPCRIVTIHLFSNNGNSSNECLVDLESENDVKDALRKTNLLLGNRYIEIYRANIYEYNFFTKHRGTITWREPVIHMNGLPYTCTMADVQNFFQDIEIARNGIYITRDMSDKALGGGYVAFVSMDNAYKAIDIYNQKSIKHRYIELTASSYDEAKKTITNDAYLNGKRFAGENEDEDKHTEKQNNGRKSRSKSKRRSKSTSRDRHSRSIKRRHSSPNSPRSRSRPESNSTIQRPRNDSRRRSRSRSPVRRSSPSTNRNGEYLIKMRGMPFTVVEDDIRKFFPSTCQPVRIEILQNRRTNRPNGDGHVYFKSMDEINEAMKFDRKYLGNRYVELYFDSPRPSSTSNTRRSKSNDSPHRSPSKPTNDDDDDHNNNNKSRSRSESEH